MTNAKRRSRADAGQARILEAVTAALIIFIVFSASSFLINSSQITIVQERTDLDRLGYNVLSRLTESGTIEATIENEPPLNVQLKAFLQNSLPSSMFFNLTITTCIPNSATQWVTFQSPPISVSNTDATSFSSSMEVSSTPMIYTSKSGNIYFLTLVLARAGEGV